MAGLPGSLQSLMPAGPDEIVRRMRDIERRMDEMGPSVAPSFSPVIADLIAKQAAITALVASLAAQVAFLSAQSFGYTSTKSWVLGTTSGSGLWHLYDYDATYDDEYTFQASSTGVLKIDISASVLLNNNSATATGATARGYSLSWSGGSLGQAKQRSAEVLGINCGEISLAASNTTIVTVPGNAIVTLQTRRAIVAPVTPDTTQHWTQDTSVVVTLVGI